MFFFLLRSMQLCLNLTVQNPNVLSKHKPFMLSKKISTSRGWQYSARQLPFCPNLILIVSTLLKYMYNFSLLKPFVLDYMIDLCCIN